VFCAAFPELGYGVAVKCDDGGTRASEVMMAAVIAKLLPLDLRDRHALERHVRPRLRNWNGIEVGQLRPAGPLA
jgi:L-asparaginase II